MTSCTLCDLPTAGQTVRNDDGEPFCCMGCRNVHATLGTVDDDAVPNTSAKPPDDGSPSIPENAETAYISVGGMHCASCEYFLEHLGREQAGVYDTDASYATEMVRVQYDPTETDEDTIVDSLSTLNYTAGTTELDTTPSDGPDLESRLLVGGIFGMMAMVWYGLFLYPTYFGYDPVVSFGQFDGAYLAAQLAIVTAIILGYTGQPMLRGAYVSLRTRQPNVDLLVSIAALAAFGYSVLRIFQGGMDLYFDVTIVVVMAVTIGNYYQERVKRSATGLLQELTSLQTEEARLASGEQINRSDIEAGAELLVKPGERIPLDGTISEGTADIDESLVTGEPVPVRRGPGDPVIGGAIVTDAPIQITVGTDATSTVDQLVTLLWDIQSSRSGVQRVADRLSTIFVPLVLLLAAGIGGWMLLTGLSVRTAILTSLTVLIVACPCALGLATPLAVASGLQSAAQNGIVVTTPELFETGNDVDVIALDKTGTLTTGTMAVQGVTPLNGDSDVLLERAAALERYVTHPVAEAVERAGTAEPKPGSDEIRTPIDSIEILDRGVSGVVDGDDVLVGHPALFENAGWTVADSLFDTTEAIWTRGGVPVVVGWNGSARGVIEVGDELRPGWESVVTELGASRKLVLLSGDESNAVEEVGAHPAIDDVFAGVPPEGKVATVKGLTAEGTVAMVGDGSNDAPALAAADVGIAMGNGTKIASDAADAVVLDGAIENLPAVFDTAGKTRRRIHQNLAWAFVYNGIAIPLALTGLLNPLFAAIAMATSSLLVVVNSMRGLDGQSAVTTDDGRTPSVLEPDAATGE